MADVIDLSDYQPHISGDAKCLACGYEWMAVAPIGTIELECPECHTFKGVFFLLTAPDVIFVCTCGNEHFYLGEEYPMCSKCGTELYYVPEGEGD